VKGNPWDSPVLAVLLVAGIAIAAIAAVLVGNLIAGGPR
jgi:hypothetical protein